MEQITGKNIININGSMFCNICNYTSKNKSNFNKHLKTKKHMELYNIYNTKCLDSNNTYNSDNSSIKNKRFTHTYNNKQLIEDNSYTCKCGKNYKHRQSLYNHKRNSCRLNNINNISQHKTQNIKQNDFIEIINKLIEQNNKTINTVTQLSNKPNTIINQQNNSVSIINFLNTECKNAKNFNDYIRNLEVTNKDLEFIHRNTLMNSIDKCFIKPITNMNHYERPIHCTNQRRHKFMIMHKGIWRHDKNNQILSDSFHEWANKVGHQLVCWSHEDTEWSNNEQKLEMSNDLIRKLHLLRFDKKTNEKVIKKMEQFRITKNGIHLNTINNLQTLQDMNT
jgi:hypothetical protein